MRTIRFFILTGLVLGLIIGFSACSYHNNDNPNEYPELEPEPIPEPEPKPETNEKYQKAAYTANCFMVKPGEAIDIPILKAYAMWDIYADMLGESNFTNEIPEPVLLWQDNPKLIASIGLIPGQKAEDGSIAVSTNNIVGNALIGIRIGGEIRWSWHIWVTRYDPDAELVAYGKVYKWDNNGDGISDYTFMDRNLGAVIDKPIIENTEEDLLAAAGLLYQWGRKDPFPGDRVFRGTNETDYNYFDSKHIYDINGNLLTEQTQAGGTGIRSIWTDADTTRTGLAKSVTNPMVFLLGRYGYNDWYCSLKPKKINDCDTLWCDSQGRKSPFDPSPEGWRVPADKNGKFVWNGFVNGTTNYSELGVFPFAGFRYCVGNGCLKNSGFTTDIWTSTIPNGVGNAYGLTIYIAKYNGQPVIKSDVSCRSNGNSIRCVRDE